MFYSIFIIFANGKITSPLLRYKLFGQLPNQRTGNNLRTCDRRKIFLVYLQRVSLTLDIYENIVFYSITALRT